MKRELVRYRAGHEVQLLRGGDELFPAVAQALAQARHEVWFATYIFNDDLTGRRLAEALIAAAERGVAVHVLVDGFGSKAILPSLRNWFGGTGVALEVFRPIQGWWSWLQPGQLRRLHQKLCSVDGSLGFVGGINVIDDRLDQNHGWTDLPRLDYAVQLRGPVAQDIERVVYALWTRAHLGHGWRNELAQLARSPKPVGGGLQLLRDLGLTPLQNETAKAAEAAEATEATAEHVAATAEHSAASATGVAGVPRVAADVRAALIVRDNLRQRRSIERSYVDAIAQAQERIDIACAYFYPGRLFRRALRHAAQRGVRVRLLMQGKIDYRFAGLAARVMYEELMASGVRVFEYTPAFLHAKVAVVDDDWATVGSSNIDPLSLLLNLEANAVVADKDFVAQLAMSLNLAFSDATEIVAPQVQRGMRGWASRGLVAWVANTYLRIAGITGRY